MEVNGIILAGGKSSRMKTDKAFLKIEGKTLIEIIFDEIKPLCKNVILSINKETDLLPKTAKVTDIYKNTGAIGGLHASLSLSKVDKNIVVSCDSPFISKSFFEFMINEAENYDICVPEFKGRIYPLLGIYNKSSFEIIEKLIIEKNYKLLNVIEQSNSKIVKITKKSKFYNDELFSNLNTPEEFNLLTKK